MLSQRCAVGVLGRGRWREQDGGPYVLMCAPCAGALTPPGCAMIGNGVYVKSEYDSENVYVGLASQVYIPHTPSGLSATTNMSCMLGSKS